MSRFSERCFPGGGPVPAGVSWQANQQALAMAMKNLDQSGDSPIRLLWLVPFILASALVASARAVHDWEATPTRFALAIVIPAIGYSMVSFHKSPAKNRLDRFGQTAFIVLVTLGGPTGGMVGRAAEPQDASSCASYFRRT